MTTPVHVRKVKQYLHHAFDTQEQRRGFSLVEILSPCPTYWRMTPADAMKRIEEELIPIFPLGVVKDWTAEEAQ